MGLLFWDLRFRELYLGLSEENVEAVVGFYVFWEIFNDSPFIYESDLIIKL